MLAGTARRALASGGPRAVHSPSSPWGARPQGGVAARLGVGAHDEPVPVTSPLPRPARLRLLGRGDDGSVPEGGLDGEGVDEDADPFGDREDDLLAELARTGRDEGDDDAQGAGWLAARGRWGVPVLAAAALLVLAAAVALVLGVRAGVLAPEPGPGGAVAARGPDGEGRSDGSGAVPTSGAGATGAPTTVERTGPVVGGAVDGPTRVPGAPGEAQATGTPDGPGAGAAGADPGGAPLTVHVVGAVVAPGVVTVPAGSRAVDAVAAAGGMTAEADPAGVNLARPLADGEQVVVPRPGEAVAAAPGAGAAGGVAPVGGAPGAPAAPVDLNTASAADLDALPGIGPVLAGRIVETRQAHGPFAAVDELVEVPGIGDAVLARLRPLVRV